MASPDTLWHLIRLSDLHAADDAEIVVAAPGAEDMPCAPDESALVRIANTSYREEDEPLVALVLDPERLAAPIRYESVGVGDSPSPRVHGPVERSAIREIRYARRDVTGAYIGFDRRPPRAEALDLLPHPEGGWFRETWRSTHEFTPAGYSGRRAAATAIYYLLGLGERSVWHRVRSDELWLWHSGGPLVVTLGGDGPRPRNGERIVLGGDVLAGEQPQVLVPAGRWQSAAPADDHGPGALVSCVVSPGFDFADFDPSDSGA